MNNTAIQWADSTLNLMMGCEGCELWRPLRGERRCYAGAMTERMLVNGPIRGWPSAFNRPAIFPERIRQAETWSDLTHTARPGKPWLDDLPRMIFLNDMGDTFSQRLSPDWLAPLLRRIGRTPHTYLLLSKRVRSMREFFERHECPSNLGCGTSVCDQDKLIGRLGALAHVRCPWRFVSCEPLWEAIDLRPWLDGRLDWVILGGESGPGAKLCDTAWIGRSMIHCQEQQVPVFIKQLGSKAYTSEGNALLRLRDDHGGDWSEWPEELRVREMPQAVIAPPTRASAI